MRNSVDRSLAVLGVKASEAASTKTAALAFGSVVASYFVLIPLRDEMSIQLGTNTLPALFASSLLVSMLSQPVTSYIVTASAGSVAGGLQRFFRIVACILIGFAVLFAAISMPTQVPQQLGADSALMRTQNTQRAMYEDISAARAGRDESAMGKWLWHNSAMRFLARLMVNEDSDGSMHDSTDVRERRRRLLQGGAVADTDVVTAGIDAVHVQRGVDNDTKPSPDAQHRNYTGEQHEHSDGDAEQRQGSFHVGSGDSSLSSLQRWLFIAFYLWMSTQNLVSSSVLWARCADVFAGRAAERIFGVIAAAATAGQLVGSATTALLCRQCGKTLPAGFQVFCLLLAAGLNWHAGFRSQQLDNSQLPCSSPFTSTNSMFEKDTTSAPASQSGGAVAKPPLPCRGSSASALGDASQDTGADPVANSMQRRSSQMPLRNGALEAKHLHRASGTLRRPTSVRTTLDVAASSLGVPAPTPKPGERLWSAGRLLLSARLWLHRLAESVSLIAKSPLLLHLCCHLVCSYMLSSLLFFGRALVLASSVQDSGGRMRWIAALHSSSAMVVLLLQLTATGKALRLVGAAGALAAVPAVTLFTTTALAWHPVPAVLMLVETSRKVMMYSFAKPARELLFTQVSTDVKYKAKLILDTVVQRSGDAAGAAVFAVLDAQTISATRLASICTCIAAVWLAVAFTLGRRYDLAMATGTQMA